MQNIFLYDDNKMSALGDGSKSRQLFYIKNNTIGW